MTHTHDRYNSLRQYVSYMILFCEEVNAEEIEQTLAELYEPICTMIELMAGLINLDFTPPVKNAPSSPKEMEEYDFIRLVPRDFYWVTGQPGSYSILFAPFSKGGSTRKYTSHSSVYAFALVSCFLQHLCNAALNITDDDVRPGDVRNIRP